MVGISAEIVKTIRLWHVLIAVAPVFCLIGLVGSVEGWFDISKDEHWRMVSFLTGLLLFAYAGIMAWLKPWERNGNGNAPKISISPTQIGYVAQFTEWETFDNASKAPCSDDDLKSAEKEIKIKELRLEMATVQKILDRKIENGVHMVKYYKSDDKTRMA